MMTYTQTDLRRELELILDPAEYDLDAILTAYQARYGLAPVSETGDRYAEIAIDHQLQPTPDPLPGFVRQVKAAVKAAKPGEVAEIAHRGVTVTIHGQSRVRLDAPTIGAQIAVDGKPCEADTWGQVLAAADEVADDREAEEAQMWSRVAAQQRQVEAARVVLDGRLKARDQSILGLISLGATDYRIAKHLGVAQTTVAAVRKRP